MIVNDFAFELFFKLKISINLPILHRRFAAFVVGTSAALGDAGGGGFGYDVFDCVSRGKC